MHAFEGHPEININFQHLYKESLTLSGKSTIVDQGKHIFNSEIIFKNYPVNFKKDIDFVQNLKGFGEEFLFYPSGGVIHPGHTVEGFRLGDVYKVRYVGNMKASFSRNVFTNPVNLSFKLKEVV